MPFDSRVLILAGVGLLAACGGASERRLEPVLEPGPEPAARTVSTATVVAFESASATVPGVVQARERATLVARLAAPIVALPFREGDRVARGAVVARLDAGALQARVNAAEADARLAAADRDRYEALVNRQAATPREAEGAQARADVAQAAVAAAKAELTLTVVRAPFAGRVTARAVNLGDVVVPGQPILELEGSGGLEVRVTVAAELLPSLTPGTVVAVQIDGLAAPLAATVRVVAPAGDPATHRFEVRAELPEAPGVAAGLFARLVVGGGGGEGRRTARTARTAGTEDEKDLGTTPVSLQSLAVPSSSLFSRGGLTGLFVIAEGRARLRWVALGAAQGDHTEIRAGVRAGERVARDPTGLTDGAPVLEERGER